MLDQTQISRELESLIGSELYQLWILLCARIEKLYDMERLWNSGGKAWTYEYKYRRGGKTLCALYAKENYTGFMIVLGKDERNKFEKDRENYSEKIQEIYEEAKTYHDGKWIMFELNDLSMFEDFMELLAIKRSPNRK